MRHLRSILYAVVLAPAVWILTGVGFNDDLHGRARQYTGVESVTGLLLLLLAGAAYAILVFSPISPAGPALFGLGYLGIAVWALSAPASYAGAWPAAVTKPGFDLSRPGYGLAALLAVPLLSTALSARRWERYEPPQLPLIGTLGRPRGAAAVAGTPVAAVTTQILALPGVGAEPADATQVIRSSGPADAEPVDAALTQAIPVGPVDAALTQAIPVGPVDAGPAVTAEEPTIVGIFAEEPTEVRPSDEPTEVRASEEPTEVGGSEDVPAAAADETTQVAAEAVTEEDSGSTADEPTQIALQADEPAETVEADESTAEAGEPIVEDATTDPPVAEATEIAAEERPVGEKTATIATDDGEKTQVIRLPVGEMPTREFKLRPGERTQVISPDRIDETQVIRLPQQRTDSPDSERTQVIRLGAGTVEPPADRTQVIRLPAPDAQDDRTTTQEADRPAPPQKPERPPSIVGEERPDPGTDPTTRLVPPRRLPLDEPVGDETTTDIGNGKRAMTVLNLERPDDELAADDTRPMALPRSDDQTT